MLFLHFSDIHFKKTEVGNPNKALRSDIIKDVKRTRQTIGGSADGILLTGDIAFAGHPDEYDFAYRWLEEQLCPAAGCKIENVFVIPGNHDVDRKVETDPAQVMAREALRSKSANHVEAELRKWMRSKIASSVIFGPIENYNRFAAKFLCPLRPYIDDDGTEGMPARPFACRDLKLNDGSTLRLWGFNMVLVSDATDDERRMLIDPAAAQIEARDDVCHVVMAHHPFNWLKNKRAFEDRCNAVAKIHLFGHEHTNRVDVLPELRKAILFGRLPPAAHTFLTDDLPRFYSAAYWDLNKRVLLSLSKLYRTFPNKSMLRELLLSESEMQLVIFGEDENSRRNPLSRLWDWL